MEMEKLPDEMPDEMPDENGKCRFRAKPVYIGGQLVYCLGMVAMAITRCDFYQQSFCKRNSISSQGVTYFNIVFVNIIQSDHQVEMGCASLLLVCRHHVTNLHLPHP